VKFHWLAERAVPPSIAAVQRPIIPHCWLLLALALVRVLLAWVLLALRPMRALLPRPAAVPL
jgi:hypothetical protein